MSDLTGRGPAGADRAPDVLGAIVRSWPVVVALALLLAFVGVVFAGRQTPTYTATSIVVVEDARSRLFDRPTTDIERYVAGQAAVIGSEPVAEAASRVVADVTAGDVSLTPEEIVRGVSVTVEDDADVLTIRFRGASAAEAEAGASAVARAYADLVEGSVRADLRAALDRLDAEIEDVRASLGSTRQRIAELRSPVTSDVDDVVAAAAAALSPDEDADPEETAAAVEQLAFALQARRELSEFEERSPELAAALQRETDFEVVLAELNDRRADLAADGTLVGSGVSFATGAGPGRAARFSTGTAALLAALLGAGLGVALVYLGTSWGLLPATWGRGGGSLGGTRPVGGPTGPGDRSGPGPHPDPEHTPEGAPPDRREDGGTEQEVASAAAATGPGPTRASGRPHGPPGWRRAEPPAGSSWIAAPLLAVGTQASGGGSTPTVDVVVGAVAGVVAEHGRDGGEGPAVVAVLCTTTRGTETRLVDGLAARFATDRDVLVIHVLPDIDPAPTATGPPLPVSAAPTGAPDAADLLVADFTRGDASLDLLRVTDSADVAALMRSLPVAEYDAVIVDVPVDGEVGAELLALLPPTVAVGVVDAVTGEGAARLGRVVEQHRVPLAGYVVLTGATDPVAG